jgi:LysR family nitrogen assimilation transcriptional regulator
MRIETQLAYLGLKPAIALELDGIGTVLDAVRENYGYAVLPRTSLRSYGALDSFSVRPIVQPRLTIQISMIISAQRPTTLLAQQVLEHLPATALQVLSPDAR